MTIPTQIYLPDFDRYAQVKWGWRHDLHRQLVYSVLAYDTVLVSAASPFKNRGGWHVLRRYGGLLDSGRLKFPLDPRYDGRIHRYIANRIRMVPPHLHDGTPNPEYVAYTDPGAERILASTDQPAFVSNRVADCDSVFRQSVLSDLQSQEKWSLAHLFDGFTNIRADVKDAQALFQSRAKDCSTLFQRFDLVSSMPSVLQRNDAYRMKVERRLDELFFAANASAASCLPIISGFSGSFAQTLYAFCASYKPSSQSLDGIITRLPDEALFRLKYSDGFQEFHSELHRWLSDQESWAAVASEIGKRLSISDALTLGWCRTLLLSLFAASLSWPGGILLSSVTPIDPSLAGWFSSAIVGCLPIVTKSLRSSSAAKVYRSPVLKPYIERSIVAAAQLRNNDVAQQEHPALQNGPRPRGPF